MKVIALTIVHALHGCISVPGGRGSHCCTVLWSHGISPAARLSGERLLAITHDIHCSFRLKVTLLQLIIKLVRRSGLLSHSIINYLIVLNVVRVSFGAILHHFTWSGSPTMSQEHIVKILLSKVKL